MPHNISAQTVKALRDQTGAGMMDAKKALEEASGDIQRASEILRKKGMLKAGKKAERETRQGIVDSYIHGEGRIGVLLEVNCETDFVARNQEFKNLVHDLALHVAAANPQYLSIETVPVEVLEKEKAFLQDQALAEGKPAEIAEKITAGRLQKFYEEVCLLEQPFVRDPDLKVRDLVNHKIATIGENIQVRRFTRYVLGQ